MVQCTCRLNAWMSRFNRTMQQVWELREIHNYMHAYTYKIQCMLIYGIRILLAEFRAVKCLFFFLHLA